MADLVEVRITDGSGRVISEGRHGLPLRIGRSQQAEIQLTDPDNQISRFHATISEAGGGSLVLLDDSLNGTDYRGRKVHKTQVPIEDRDTFAVRQFRVEVKRVAQSNEPAAFNAVFVVKGHEHVYAVGPTFLVVLLDGQRASVDEVRPRDPAAILKYYADAGREALAVIGVKDGFGTVTTTPQARERKLTINRGVPLGGTEPLRVLDVVALGRMRIEILKPDTRALKCKNSSCQLLNPYDIGENCRFCGHRLVEGETRLVRG